MIRKKINFDGKVLNVEISELKNLFKKAETFEKGKTRFLNLHSHFYRSVMSGSSFATFEDQLWDGLTEEMARSAVNAKGRTVLYGLWHSSRIEDITMNLLVRRGDQIYTSGKFQKLINAGIDHTGNSLSEKEILQMSARVNIKALCGYRQKVGKKTQEIIKALSFDDLKRKVLKSDIERVRAEGAVDDVPSANWLLDFWGRRNVEGILFMPAGRHQIIHFNENFRAKEKGLRSGKVYGK